MGTCAEGEGEAMRAGAGAGWNDPMTHSRIHLITARGFNWTKAENTVNAIIFITFQRCSDSDRYSAVNANCLLYLHVCLRVRQLRQNDDRR